jgi:DNA topoisomerase-2
MAGAPKEIEDKYQRHTLLTHIRALPDTYIGSIEKTQLATYLWNADSKKFVEETISYVPGFYKIFDEVLVNAVDQVARLISEVKTGKEDVRPVKNIRVSVNVATGWITVTNDGDGIDVEKHTRYNDIWVPEMIFGELLTSSNYDQGEERLWGGKNGYGAKLANIFSKEFIVETIDHRRKRSYRQRFYENMEHRDKPVVKASTKAPYTTIQFLPDYAKFGMTGMEGETMRLFEKRVYDACATTPNTVSVYFNDVKLEAKDFEKYCDLYIGGKDDTPRAYESCNDRWEVLATTSDNGQFHQVSFVNGINTLKGGKHVEYITNQITKKLTEIASSKKKKEIKPQHIRDNLWVFVKCAVVNPAFDSQTKETLTTQMTKFGSKCELSDKFFDKLLKTGILDKAVSLTEFHDKKKLAKTDGKKTSRVLVPKLDDANEAGTKHSRHCTLILTEGDSAKSMAIAGLSVVGRDRYGVFPLRGKMLNVKDETLKKIMENEEITNLKKIMGLVQGKEYKSIDDLRYGKIMVMTDQDHDGSHIKGLLFNIFQSLWPSLYKMPSFLTSMLTPIVKAMHSQGRVIEFYNLTDFEDWKKRELESSQLRGWTVKYYKGLGTSTAEEAKKYFKDLKVLEYKYTGKESDAGIDLAFNKKRADDRKAWLEKYDRSRVLDYSKTDVPYETFIHDELIHFSNRTLERMIPSVVDGLKESQRKILFGCFKKKLYTREIRVAQLSGYISEVAVYHHGEKSLQEAIVTMAQDFVGANNINYLLPNGQFGTRIQGGDDAASARYIHTLLSPMARKIFREADAPVLTYLDDDGIPIEPETYVPIIPTVLINGALGIATGFSTNLPSHNPSDIIAICLSLIDALDKHKDLVNIDTKAELENAYQVMNKVGLPELHPWYLGFTGEITKAKEGVYQSRGVWRWLDDTRLEITELPIGTWTDNYKDFLTDLVANNSPVLKDFESHYTEKQVHFILHFYPGVRVGVEQNLETEFKLVSSKNLNLNNIHLFNEHGTIQRYENVHQIIREWSTVRLSTYLERKKHQLRRMEADYRVLSAKVRFIQDVISGKVDIMNKKMKDIEDQLSALKYPKLYVAEKMPTMEEEGLEGETSNEAKGPADYDYLIRMPMKQLTLEKKQALEKEAKDLEHAIQVLRETPIQKIWRLELEELSKDWEHYRQSHEAGYGKKDKDHGDAPGPSKTKTITKKRFVKK